MFGPLAIVAVVLSYTRRNEVRGTWLEVISRGHQHLLEDMAASFGGVMSALVMMFLMPMGLRC